MFIIIYTCSLGDLTLSHIIFLSKYYIKSVNLPFYNYMKSDVIAPGGYKIDHKLNCLILLNGSYFIIDYKILSIKTNIIF